MSASNACTLLHVVLVSSATRIHSRKCSTALVMQNPLREAQQVQHRHDKSTLHVSLKCRENLPMLRAVSLNAVQRAIEKRFSGNIIREMPKVVYARRITAVSAWQHHPEQSRSCRDSENFGSELFWV